MGKIRKIIAIIITTVMMLSFMPELPVKAATLTTAKVFYMDYLTAFNRKAGLSAKASFSVPETKTRAYVTGKFTLTKNSYVRLETGFECNGSLLFWDCYVYANSSMTNPINKIHDIDTAEKYMKLNKGTYYYKYVLDNEYRGNYRGTITTSIGAMPVEKAVSYTKTYDPTTKKCIVKFKQNVYSRDDGDADVWEARIHYLPGKVTDNSDSFWRMHNRKEIDGYTTKKGYMPKSGYITLRTHFCERDELIYIKGVYMDTQAPTVFGVKNGGTYSGSVKFKVQDNASGTKAATYDGKAITPGKVYTVTKKGKHTVKAKDKVGNYRAVTFTVK